MIYVTLSSNGSMDFKVNLPETLQVDPDHWEVAMKEIQFPRLWNNVRNDKNYFIDWYNTVIGYSFEKIVAFKFIKEIKAGYYSSMPEMVAELNAKVPTEPMKINLHLNGFDICFDYDFFQQVYCDYVSWSINKNGWIRLGFVNGIQTE